MPPMHHIEIFIRQFVERLRALALRAKEKQGSEALESIVSLYQYAPAYRWILANIPRGSRVLDWGCGNGHFSIFLREAGYVVTSYGFQPPELLALVSPTLVEYVAGSDPVQLPFPDSDFDCVVSIGVLEHVREVGGDEVASVREIRRVLKDRGVFYCYHLPNKYSWIEFVSRVLGKWSHSFRYSRTDVLRIFDFTGMSIDRLVRYGVLPRNTLRKLRVLRLTRSFVFARWFDVTDRLLLPVFGFVAQNWALAARKTDGEGVGCAQHGGIAEAQKRVGRN